MIDRRPHSLGVGHTVIPGLEGILHREEVEGDKTEDKQYAYARRGEIPPILE